MTKKKLLVTGAGGFLGWHLCRAVVRKYNVTGVCRVRPVTVPGVRAEQCDITDFRSLRELFLRIKPDAVIHAAAESKPDFCQEHPDLTKKINVDASLAIAGLCGDRGIPCAFTSSDLVFDGKNAPYNEERAPSPISVYGEQKAAAEAGMRDRCGSVIVCRMPLMYGDAPPQASSFLHPLLLSILAGKEPGLYTDEFRTPVSGGSAARGLLLALSRPPGVLHLGGRERLSRYDFAVKLARALGMPDAPIKKASLNDAAQPAPRPADVSLDSRKAFVLGYNPLSVDDQLNVLEAVKKARKRP
jgi:dTDP-4-dehydrorhamnose reductase